MDPNAGLWQGGDAAACPPQGVPSSDLRMRSLLLVSLLLAMTPGWAAPKDSSNRYGKAGLPRPCQVGGMGKEPCLGERPSEAPCDSLSLAVLLYLFALHDYDRSGQLDGLEFMHLHPPVLCECPISSVLPLCTFPLQVIVVVDGILETQDLNGDGLLNPSELLLPLAQGQPPLPAQTATPTGEGVVQWAPEESELPGTQGAADPGGELPEAAGPVAEQPGAEALLLSRTGPEAAQPEEEAAGEDPGAQAMAPNAEI
uniref:EF-hand domain-containing protein n=1 Tax=Chelonoidis abingdonii TaxID=106734 RepID=A0A8C0IKH6_CHEAB